MEVGTVNPGSQSKVVAEPSQEPRPPACPSLRLDTVDKHPTSRVKREEENSCAEIYSLRVSVKNARSEAFYEPFLQDEL